MQDKATRALNKPEQKLFARLYAASVLGHGVLHYVAVSDKEETGIDCALDELVSSLSRGHELFRTTAEIVNYIKSLRT